MKSTKRLPLLTDVISKDALRIFLQGFYKRTHLSVSIYVDSKDTMPIFNPGDANEICMENRRSDNPNGCLKRNVKLAREVLKKDDKEALKELNGCPFGLQHVARVIRDRRSDQPIAVLYFGGVVTDKSKIGKGIENIESVYMNATAFKKSVIEFEDYVKNLEDYYYAHVTMMQYAARKTVLASYRSMGEGFASFLETLSDDLDITFEKILDYLGDWTQSRLNALCILDPEDSKEGVINGKLVVRSIRGIDQLQMNEDKNLYGPEVFDLEGSFLAEPIRTKTTCYTENIKYSQFQWQLAVTKLNVNRALTLPLVLASERQPLGALICFPERDIWSAELPMFDKLAKKVAAAVHLAIQKELYSRSKRFSDGLAKVSEQLGYAFCSEMTELIKNTLNAAAVSIFLIVPERGKLKLAGSTDDRESVKELVGEDIYDIGEGITGLVAAQTDRIPYGEIIYDLYDDERRSPNFEELIPETPSGKHSMLCAQIVSPDMQIIGVIRCVDVRKESNAVFNCFNHFYLEVVQFWAEIIGIVYTLKERMRLNHEFILSFAHEFGSSFGAVRNTLELTKYYVHVSDTDSTRVKLQDAINISSVTAQLLENMRIGSMLALGKRIKTIPQNYGKYSLVKDFLMPMKEAFKTLAKTERWIDIRFKSGHILVVVDKNQITQVFTNLITNAIKYSHDPKNRSVKKSMLTDIEVIVRHGDFGELYIDFINQGLPIDLDEKEIIFNEYRKGRHAGEQSAGGLGLGLFICREIMRNHDGDIFVTSCRNPTIITLRFPSSRVIKLEER